MNTLDQIKLINYCLPDGRIITKNPDARVLLKELPRFVPNSKPRFQMMRHKIPDMIEELKQRLHSCDLCVHHCGVNRLRGESGRCRTGLETYFFTVNLSVWEEKLLNPCWVVSLFGCESHCVFCSWPELFAINDTKTPLAKLWDYINPKTYNIMFSGGGSPIPSTHAILRFLNDAQDDFNGRIIWKSNFTENSFLYSLLPMDYWVMDIKFGNDMCAKKLGNLDNYILFITSNLQSLLSVGDRNIIIRHLLLPDHHQCCTANVFHLLRPYKEKIILSINPDFIPEYRSLEFSLARFITDEKKERACNLANSLGFKIIT